MQGEGEAGEAQATSNKGNLDLRVFDQVEVAEGLSDLDDPTADVLGTEVGSADGTAQELQPINREASNTGESGVHVICRQVGQLAFCVVDLQSGFGCFFRND